MALSNLVRHRMDAVKEYVNNKLDETFNRLPDSAINLFKKSTISHTENISDDDDFSLVSHFESLLVEFQALLVWDNPANSSFALTFFTVFYWILAWLHPSFLSCAAMVGFCYHFYEMWIRYIWPAIRVPELDNEEIERWTKMNMNALTAPEIEEYIRKAKIAFLCALQNLSTLRAESHGKFCGIFVTIFSLIFLVTRNIPGVLLFYGFAITIFLTPGILLHILPKEYLDTILNFCLTETSHESLASPFLSSLPPSSSFSPTSSIMRTTNTESLMKTFEKTVKNIKSNIILPENTLPSTISAQSSPFLASNDEKHSNDSLEESTKQPNLKIETITVKDESSPILASRSSESIVCNDQCESTFNNDTSFSEQVPAEHLSLNNEPEVELLRSSHEYSIESIYPDVSSHTTRTFDESIDNITETSTNTDSLPMSKSFSSQSNTEHSSFPPSTSTPDQPICDDDQAKMDKNDAKDECLVKSNYCENFFSFDRNSIVTPQQSQTSSQMASSLNHDDDTLGEDYEIISDSELELLTSKRNF